MAEWSPEIVVDEALAGALIAEQMPALAGHPLRLLATGWDNTVFAVGDRLPRWVVRFPRRAVAVPGIRREITLLPELGPQLPVAVPAPIAVGRPSERHGYPWPFFAAPFIAGHEVAERAPGAGELAALAQPLGAFLRALHRPALAEALASRLPTDPVRRADMAYRVERTRERLATLAELALWRPPLSLETLLDEALSLPPSAATSVVHGDLHIRHLLLADGGGIGGVIDWGDLALSDPAVDLVLYWSLLPPGARDAFVDAYGPVTRPMLIRARLLSVFLCGTLAIYARHEALPALEQAALACLDRTMAG